MTRIRNQAQLRLREWYLGEFAHLTLAKALLARSARDRSQPSVSEATRLLARLLQAAEEGERTGRTIEVLVMQALAHQARGDIPAALAALQRALTLGEPTPCALTPRTSTPSSA